MALPVTSSLFVKPKTLLQPEFVSAGFATIGPTNGRPAATRFAPSTAEHARFCERLPERWRMDTCPRSCICLRPRRGSTRTVEERCEAPRCVRSSVPSGWQLSSSGSSSAAWARRASRLRCSPLTESVNGWSALVARDAGRTAAVVTIETDGQKVVAVRNLLNPEKLALPMVS
jgi:hypothetical protein